MNVSQKKDIQKEYHTQGLNEIVSKRNQWIELENNIKIIGEQENRIVKTQVNLGQNFFCQAKITDKSKIFVNLQHGFFVEMTLEEASSYVEKRIGILNDWIGKIEGRVPEHQKK